MMSARASSEYRISTRSPCSTHISVIQNVVPAKSRTLAIRLANGSQTIGFKNGHPGVDIWTSSWQVLSLLSISMLHTVFGGPDSDKSSVSASNSTTDNLGSCIDVFHGVIHIFEFHFNCNRLFGFVVSVLKNKSVISIYRINKRPRDTAVN